MALGHLKRWIYKRAPDTWGDLLKIVRSQLSWDIISICSQQEKRHGVSTCSYTIFLVCVKTRQLIVSDANRKLKVTRVDQICLSGIANPNRLHWSGSIVRREKLWYRTDIRLGVDRMSVLCVSFQSFVSPTLVTPRNPYGRHVEWVYTPRLPKIMISRSQHTAHHICLEATSNAWAPLDSHKPPFLAHRTAARPLLRWISV